MYMSIYGFYKVLQDVYRGEVWHVLFKNAQTKIQFTGLADSIIMMYVHILRSKDKGPV